jgi:NADPH2:quinone reductase
MKAAVYYTNGGPEVFRYEEVARPACAPDGVLIEVAVISVEGGDLISREYDVPASVPHIVGYQCAGVIVEVGDQVTNRHTGQRVVTIVPNGAYAEWVAASAAVTWLVPEGMDLESAASVPVAWGAAHECLFGFGNLQRGETVLIHAGAGAVGLAAIQLAKRAGATVLTTASGGERLARLAGFGADLAIDYVNEDFVAATKDFTGGVGVDMVVDSLAGDNLVRSIAALKYRGRVMQVGRSGRDGVLLDPVALWANCNSVQGVFFPTSLPKEYARTHAAVTGMLADIAAGSLRVVIDRTFPLSQAEAAHRYILGRKAFGRVLLRPGS